MIDVWVPFRRFVAAKHFRKLALSFEMVGIECLKQANCWMIKSYNNHRKFLWFWIHKITMIQLEPNATEILASIRTSVGFWYDNFSIKLWAFWFKTTIKLTKWTINWSKIMTLDYHLWILHQIHTIPMHE